MNKKIKSLNDVFLDELADLYNAEHQLLKALPKLAEASASEDLKATLQAHCEKTKEHANRLKEIFQDLGHRPVSATCKAMKGLIEEGEDIVSKSDRCAARDAAIIGAAQRVEHYEIAGYGTAKSHASLLGLERVQELLQETLDEERDADQRLNELAEGSINSQAKQMA